GRARPGAVVGAGRVRHGRADVDAGAQGAGTGDPGIAGPGVAQQEDRAHSWPVARHRQMASEEHLREAGSERARCGGGAGARLRAVAASISWACMARRPARQPQALPCRAASGGAGTSSGGTGASGPSRRGEPFSQITAYWPRARLRSSVRATVSDRDMTMAWLWVDVGIWLMRRALR